MPKVGNQKFPYTKKGEEAAEKFSKKTGKPMKVAKGKNPFVKFAKKGKKK